MKKHFFTRAAALLCAVCIGSSMLTACNGKSNSSSQKDGQNVSMEDLIYGATQRFDKKEYSVPIQYDKRFFTEDMLKVIADYYHSIEAQDADLFVSVQLPIYHKYEMETVYENKYTDEEFVKSSHKTWADKMGDDYKYSMIDITACTVSRVHSSIASVLEMLDGIAKDAGEKAVSEEITEIYELTVDLYMTPADSGIVGETQNVNNDQVLFVLVYQDRSYVLFT